MRWSLHCGNKSFQGCSAKFGRKYNSLIAGQTIAGLRADSNVASAMKFIPHEVLDATVKYAQGPGRATDPDSWPTDKERRIVEGKDTHIPFKSHVSM